MNRAILFAAMTLAMSSGTRACESVRSEIPQPGSCVIADPNPPTNARSAPGTSARIVRKLDNGTEVDIAETRGSWVYVAGECDDQIGWVYRPLITCGHK